MEKKSTSNQQIFIESIRKILPSNMSLVNELSDLLEISVDSAYRRIRCETTFTFDEIIKICNHYNISFDSFRLHEKGIVNFKYNLLLNSVESFNDYIKWILEGMKRIGLSKDKEIIYVADDIPIFQLFKFPELAAFKMFYWMKSVVNVPELEGKKYDPSLISDSLMEEGKHIFKLYEKIPSTEIWCDSTVNSAIKQIEYFNEAGFFSTKEDALHICKALEDVLADIQIQAERSTKAAVAGFENNFIMYNSDIEIGNNCIFVSSGETKSVYLRYHTFNSMVTANAEYCNETEQWMKGMIKKSTLISGVSEKQRYQFFRKSQEQIDRLKGRIG
jgi:hypothetical protein